MSVADLEALSQDMAALSHLRKRVQKGKRCSKGWKIVYSTGSETRGKVCPYTQMTQGVGRTTIATGTLKAATKVLDQEQWSPLLRDVITKGHPREERRSCQKARVAPEVILAAKTERWAMPTWCHMFNSTLTGNARQKKCIKDPVEIHNIRQRDRESTEEFVRRYKLECGDVKGAPECMKISGFMHGITNPELIKRLHDKIPKSVDEMKRVTIAFLRGEVAASIRERKKSFPSWKQQEANQNQNFNKGGFWNQQRSERKQDRFALLTKLPKKFLL
ncbi:hypothetical protein Tco_0630931 [Tanacetum coccineum]